MSAPGATAGAEPIRVVRIIARLNIGGPAIQAITLTERLEPLGYRTTLVRGQEGSDEGNMDYLAQALGVRPMLVRSLRRDPAWRDLRALVALIGIVHRARPDVVHTHAAKAGTLGRVATLVAAAGRSPRPVLVHTYHGHSLSGYFSPRTGVVYRWIERILARYTDALIAVSPEVRDELVALNVARPDRFVVVPLGFDLAAFAAEPAEQKRRRDRLRHELGIPPDAQLVTLVARLVPIKRVDRFLRVADALATRRANLHFLVVGDGELREQLRASAEATNLDGRLTWAGFRRDLPDVCFASDAVVLTSDNEGTPVSLIEALAAGTPVVATRVGGVSSVVADGISGFAIGRDDEAGIVDAVARLLDDPSLKLRTQSNRDAVAKAFALDELVGRVDGLYRDLLIRRGDGAT